MNKSITSYLIIFFFISLFASAGAFVYFYFFSGPKFVISNLEITNIADGSATVSWISSEPTPGVAYLSITDSWNSIQGKKIIYDDRDINFDEDGNRIFDGIIDNFYAHHVTIDGLDPEKQYFIRIGDGEKIYNLEEDEIWPTFTTASTLEQVIVPNVVYGKVINEVTGEPVTDAIVTIKLEDSSQNVISTVGSTFLNENGSYTLDISNLRNLDLSNTIKDSQISRELIQVISAKELNGSSTRTSPDIDQPVPDIKVTIVNNEVQANSTSELLMSVNAQNSCEGAVENYDELCPDGINVRKVRKVCGPDCTASSRSGCTWGPGSSIVEECPATSTSTPAPTQSDSGTNTGSTDSGSSNNTSSSSNEGSGVRPQDNNTCPAETNDVRCVCDGNVYCHTWQSLGNRTCNVFCSQVSNGSVQTSTPAPSETESSENNEPAEFSVPIGGTCSRDNSVIECQTSYCADDGTCQVAPITESTPVATEATSTPRATSRTGIDGSTPPACAVNNLGPNYSPRFIGPTHRNRDRETASYQEFQGSTIITHTVTYRCVDGDYQIEEDIKTTEENIVNETAAEEKTAGSIAGVQASGNDSSDESSDILTDNLCNPPDTKSYLPTRSCKVRLNQNPNKDFPDEISFGHNSTNNTYTSRKNTDGFDILSESCTLSGYENNVSNEIIWLDHQGNGEYSGTNKYPGSCDMPSLLENGRVNVYCSGSLEGLFDGTAECVRNVENNTLEYRINGETYTSTPIGFNLNNSLFSSVQAQENEGDLTAQIQNEEPTENENTESESIEENPSENESLNTNDNNEVDTEEEISESSLIDGFDGPGVYKLNVEGYEITTEKVKIVEVDEKGKPIVNFFNDINGDGFKDEGEEFIDDVEIEILSINKEESGEDFELDKGWNLIGFPIFPTEEIERTAGGFLREVNNQGFTVTQISKYQNGKWTSYTYRKDTDEEYGTNFQLIPGEGYFVKSYSAGKFVIAGNKYESAVPIDFVGGWNLINILSPQESYTAGSMLDSLESWQIGADTVSKYSNGLYTNVVKEEDVLYGNDFDLFPKQGYFVRINEGSGGNWKP